jgi:hypothetical protein
MNLIFFSIILPYIKKNSEVLFNKLNEESGKITLIIYLRLISLLKKNLEKLIILIQIFIKQKICFLLFH